MADCTKMRQQVAIWMIITLQILTFIMVFNHFYLPPASDKHPIPGTTSTPKVLAKKTRLDRIARLSNYNDLIFERLDKLISRKADSRDPELIELAKEIMDPPATSHPVKMSRSLYKTPQAVATDSYLQSRIGGFFVEVGGYDGERSSNTIFFEVVRKWNGLLIEADPFFYTQLLGKNRRCWSINACLSPSGYASKLRFKESYTGQGRVVLDREEKSHMGKASEKNLTLYADEMIVPCFPLETLLLSLGQKKIDFFSLDVEGVELDILKTIDFQRMDIESLAVEYTHGNKTNYKVYMNDHGYKVLTEINVADSANFLYADDFIFVKNIKQTV